MVPKTKNPGFSGIFAGKTGVFVNESGGTRTLDPRIKSAIQATQFSAGKLHTSTKIKLHDWRLCVN
jgi:hypothetical protein